MWIRFHNVLEVKIFQMNPANAARALAVLQNFSQTRHWIVQKSGNESSIQKIKKQKFNRQKFGKTGKRLSANYENSLRWNSMITAVKRSLFLLF